MYILTNHSKGISSLQLASWLGVTQKTGWFLNQRIREMLKENDPELLTGIVEVDETYIGGKESNKHVSKRKGQGGWVKDKTMVFGAIQRGGEVKTKVIPSTDIKNINSTIQEFIEPNSTMVSDEHRAYTQVKAIYNHKTVKHGQKEYVRKEEIIVHTNNIEGYWNVLKKQINGIHHFVSAKHLQRYCNESTFRFNRKKTTQDEKFSDALKNCEGRLTYKELIGK